MHVGAGQGGVCRAVFFVSVLVSVLDRSLSCEGSREVRVALAMLGIVLVVVVASVVSVVESVA